MIKYRSNRKKVEIICKKHGVFTQTPDNHVHGQGCPSCSKTGFDNNKPGVLYYLKIFGGSYYKIGITNRTVKERFTNTDLEKIEVVKVWRYENGKDARDAETAILRDFKYAIIDECVLGSGNTEIFDRDVLNLDIRSKDE